VVVDNSEDNFEIISVNQIIDEINNKNSIIETDPLDSEVRIPDWILHVVCRTKLH